MRSDVRKFTAYDRLDKDFAENIASHNAGFRSLKFSRGTPTFWEPKDEVILAMARLLGVPTFYIALSPGERMRFELIQILYK